MTKRRAKKSGEADRIGPPTLDEAFRYSAAKRSTSDGRALAALDGDRDALRQFAEAGIVCVESATVDPGTRDFLLSVLAAIAAGEEPNTAFGWTQAGAVGRPGKQKSFRALRKAWLIGRHARGLKVEHPELSLEDIFERVAAAESVSPATVRDAYNSFGDIG